MAIESPSVEGTLTLQDLVDRLGRIPLSRILAHPAPGSATESDLIRVNDAKQRICELVDGVLVEKPLGFREPLIAALLIRRLLNLVEPRKLGIVTAPDGTIKLAPGLVRVPDVVLFLWALLPGQEVPEEPIPQVVPTLAIEVLSQSNTKAEMERKRREYFRPACVSSGWSILRHEPWRLSREGWTDQGSTTGQAPSKVSISWQAFD